MVMGPPQLLRIMKAILAVLLGASSVGSGTHFGNTSLKSFLFLLLPH